MRAIVTRPAPQAGAWVNALRDAGLEALSLPLIEIAGPPEPQALHAAWQRWPQWDALMFVSANAVAHFFALQPPGIAWPESAAQAPRCFATGPGTVAALQQAGVPRNRVDAPDAASRQFDSESLWQVVQGQVQPGWRVLIVRGDRAEASDGAEASTSHSVGVGRDWFAERLMERGAQVEFVVAYARRTPTMSADAQALVQQASRDGTVWVFSSSEAVANLCSLVPGQSWGQARAVATHPRIAEVARAAGFGQVGTSHPTLAALLASIESLA